MAVYSASRLREYRDERADFELPEELFESPEAAWEAWCEIYEPWQKRRGKWDQPHRPLQLWEYLLPTDLFEYSVDETDMPAEVVVATGCFLTNYYRYKEALLKLLPVALLELCVKNWKEGYLNEPVVDDFLKNAVVYRERQFIPFVEAYITERRAAQP